MLLLKISKQQQVLLLFTFEKKRLILFGSVAKFFRSRDNLQFLVTG